MVTVIVTLAIDGWAVTFGTAKTGLGGLQPRPGINADISHRLVKSCCFNDHIMLSVLAYSVMLHWFRVMATG